MRRHKKNGCLRKRRESARMGDSVVNTTEAREVASKSRKLTKSQSHTVSISRSVVLPDGSTKLETQTRQLQQDEVSEMSIKEEVAQRVAQVHTVLSNLEPKIAGLSAFSMGMVQSAKDCSEFITCNMSYQAMMSAVPAHVLNKYIQSGDVSRAYAVMFSNVPWACVTWLMEALISDLVAEASHRMLQEGKSAAYIAKCRDLLVKANRRDIVTYVWEIKCCLKVMYPDLLPKADKVPSTWPRLVDDMTDLNFDRYSGETWASVELPGVNIQVKIQLHWVTLCVVDDVYKVQLKYLLEQDASRLAGHGVSGFHKHMYQVLMSTH